MGETILSEVFPGLTIKSKDDKLILIKLVQSKFMLPTSEFKHVDRNTRNQVLQLAESLRKLLDAKQTESPIVTVLLDEEKTKSSKSKTLPDRTGSNQRYARPQRVVWR